MSEICWLFKNKCLEKEPKDQIYYGFVYKITDDKGRVYYGKKAFTHRKRTKLSKKKRAATGKRVIIEQINSKWLQYWGSCKPLLAYIAEKGNTNGFKREILKLCYNRASLSYWEAEIMFREKVMFDSNCWNSNILCKFFKGKIHE